MLKRKEGGRGEREREQEEEEEEIKQEIRAVHTRLTRDIILHMNTEHPRH